MDSSNPETSSESRGMPELIKVGLVLLFLLAVVVITMWATKGSEAKALINEVTEEPRTGVVVSNVGDEVCLMLLNEAGKADGRKSCVKISRIFNYGLPSYGQPAIAAPLGDIYEVHRVKDFGVSDGLVFYPDHGTPVPAPTPGVEVIPESK